MRYTSVLFILVGIFGFACGGSASGGEGNSETHFLAFCAGKCADGLACVCGVCTVTCERASTCAGLDDHASCQGGDAYPDTCGDDTRPSVCDVTCTRDSECASLGGDYACVDGFCRQAGCVYEGQPHQVGEEFPAPNSSCNSCTCQSDGEVICTRSACVTCEYAGASYAAGEGFPSEDGCNTCTCMDDGGVACTERDCVDPSGCEYAGMSYAIGESFPSSDGCNTCSCFEDGSVGCTLRACAEPGMCSFGGQTYAPGDTFPDDCNNCTCLSDGNVECTDDCTNYCAIGDQVYADGESFPADDGCNTCTCDGATGLAACSEIACASGCTQPDTGSLEPVGATWAIDNCNTCTCTEMGWSCTEIACLPTCDYAGETHADGESFPAGDSCNTCTCQDGEAVCTLAPCVDPCTLPFEVGDCDGAIPVYWYDSETGACEMQSYGGCGGNANNFATLEECEASCL